MRASSQSETSQSLQSAVKAFFDKVSECPPPVRWCLECGQEMQYLQARFFLSGTDFSWQVLLPVCPCELERGITAPSIKQ